MTRALPDLLSVDGGTTTMVCLDCAVPNLRQGGPDSPLGGQVIRFGHQFGANSWARAHRGLGHDAVTVPGWPQPVIATAEARAHLVARGHCARPVPDRAEQRVVPCTRSDLHPGTCLP